MFVKEQYHANEFFGIEGSFQSVSNIAIPYRYGFNGKERDDEVSGNGNVYDYGFRIYNPRIGKFLSRDPLAASFAWYTPYQFAGNKPIIAIDLDGKEEYIVIHYRKDGKLYGVEMIYVPKWVYPYQTTNETRDQYMKDKKRAVESLKNLEQDRAEKTIKKAEYNSWKQKLDEFIAEADQIIAEQDRLIAENNAQIDEDYKKVGYVEKDLSDFDFYSAGNGNLNGRATDLNNNPFKLREFSSDGVLEEGLRQNEQLWINTEAVKNSSTALEHGKRTSTVAVMAEGFPTDLDVQFKTNKAELTTQDKTNIQNNLFNSLQSYPGLKIELTGNTDNRSTTYPGGNEGLSLDRANAIKNYLVELGIDSSRITTSGAGASNPVGDNSTPEGRAQNRRTDVKTIE
ncbi:MAG: OmpA family protein [Brumimicrobium sp.]